MWSEYLFEPNPLPAEMLESKIKHQKTLETNPTDENALQNLLVICGVDWSAEESYRYGNILLENYSDDDYIIYSTHYNWGRLEFSMQNFEKAVEHFQKCLEYERYNSKDEIYSFLGCCYAHLKDYKAAERYFLITMDYESKQYFGPLMTIQPTPPVVKRTSETWVDIGIVYSYMNQHEEAIKYFKERLEDVPEDWYVLYCIALCYQRLGDDLRALSYYYKALDQNPEQPEIYTNLGAVAFNLQGKIPEAIEHMETALKHIDDDLDDNNLKSTLYLNMSRLHRKLANYDKAEYYKGEFMKALGFEVELVDDEDEEGEDDDFSKS